MSANAFAEFKAYRKLAEEMIAKATKGEVAEVARIPALQSAASARKFGDLPVEDHLAYLRATDADAARFVAGEDGGKTLGVPRDGAVALVGVLGVVTEGIGPKSDNPMQ